METFLPYVISATDAEELRLSIDSLEARTHQITSHSGVKSGFAGILPEFVVKAMTSGHHTLPSYTLKTILLNDLDSRSPLQVVVPISPTKNLLQYIQQWAHEHVITPVTLTIDTDRSIGAGMIVEYKGRRYDYSLKFSL